MTAPSDATSYNPYQNYTVQNLTDHEVHFLGYGVIDGPNTQPDNGPGQKGNPTVIPPGGTFTFQLGPGDGRVEAFLGYGDSPSDPEYARYSLTFYHGSGFYVRDETRCEGSGGDGSCSGISTFNAILLPPAGTTLEITDKREQSLILNMLCRDRSNCAFQQTNFTQPGQPVQLPNKVIGGFTSNGLNPPAPLYHTFSEKTTQTHTISVSVTARVGVQIDDLVSGSFASTYSQSWTSSVSYSQTDSFDIPPNGYGWLSLSVPANRLTGTIYAQYNNVQYALTGIEFNQPVESEAQDIWTPVTCSHEPVKGTASCT